MKYRLHVIALLLPTLLASCSHKPAPIAAPAIADSNTCDSVNITYKKDIQPVFNSNCYSCHGRLVTNNGEQGFDMEDSASLKQYLLFDFRGDGIYGSKLYHCILHAQYALPMPPAYVIDSCSRHKIKHWLSMGAPM